jgi:hypothetical protein
MAAQQNCRRRAGFAAQAYAKGISRHFRRIILPMKSDGAAKSKFYPDFSMNLVVNKAALKILHFL